VRYNRVNVENQSVMKCSAFLLFYEGSESEYAMKNVHRIHTTPYDEEQPEK